MQDNQFSYSTHQAARLLSVAPETLRVAISRLGAYRGVKPRKVGSRWLWPRAEVLALSGVLCPTPRTVIDLRATNPWLEELSIPTGDPIAEKIAIALNDPRDLAGLPQSRIDEWAALRGWFDAALKRFDAARHRMTPEQITDGLRAQALAIAAVVSAVPSATLDQAICDVVGGAA